jgi:hypothetical protein
MDNQEFLTLSPSAKLLFLTFVTQRKISLCGILAVTCRAWSEMTGLSMTEVDQALRELSKHFVVIDEHTEELWVRTFIRHDKVLAKPNVIVRMTHDFCEISSPQLRELILDSLPNDLLEAAAKGLPEPLPKGLPKPLPERFAEGFRVCARARSTKPPSTNNPPSPLTPQSGSELLLVSSPSPTASGRVRKKRSPGENTNAQVGRDFEEFWLAYPKRPNPSKKEASEKFFLRRREGVPAAEMLIGARNYALNRAREDPVYTMEASRFLGRQEHWRRFLENSETSKSIVDWEKRAHEWGADYGLMASGRGDVEMSRAEAEQALRGQFVAHPRELEIALADFEKQLVPILALVQ